MFLHVNEFAIHFMICRIAVEKFSSLVDFWITFNEPHVFTMLTYCAGAWPGGDPNLLETATMALPQGLYNKVMHLMAEAHIKAYDVIHKFWYALYH
jgi:beta-glucosidase/6-phospho-beta-glucosidase/beta-galactosidase